MLIILSPSNYPPELCIANENLVGRNWKNDIGINWAETKRLFSSFQRRAWTLFVCLLFCNLHQDKQNLKESSKYWVVNWHQTIFSLFTSFIINSFNRIFNNSTAGAQKPKWISPRSQLAICSGLVSIQVRPDLGWFDIFTGELSCPR